VHNLPITRAAFTNGGSPFRYVEPFGADVFLSSDPNDVSSTLEAGFAAATMLPSGTSKDCDNQDKLCIAFDGDAVVFMKFNRSFQSTNHQCAQPLSLRGLRQRMSA